MNSLYWPCLLVMTSCWIQAALFESFLSHNRNNGHLLIFFQMLSVVCVGGVSRYLKRSQHVRTTPIYVYIGLSLLYVVSNQINALALSYGISFPLFTLFRSCSAAGSLLVGKYFFKKSYNSQQILGVILITIGITTCTLKDSMLHTKFKNPISCPSTQCCDSNICRQPSIFLRENKSYVNSQNWVYGACLMIFGLFLGGFLGHAQSLAVSLYGRNNKLVYEESMHFIHLFSLPILFGLDWKLYRNTMKLWNESESVFLPFSIRTPILLLLLPANLVTNYWCIRSVYFLSMECNPVTLSIILTSRKISNLVFSVLFFGNELTAGQVFGSLIVFFGVFIYADVFAKTKSNK